MELLNKSTYDKDDETRSRCALAYSAAFEHQDIPFYFWQPSNLEEIQLLIILALQFLFSYKEKAKESIARMEEVMNIMDW